MNQKYSDAEVMKIFRDYYDKGMSQHEIADKYGMPHPSVEKCLERKSVRERYKEELIRRQQRAEIRASVAAIKAQDASPRMMDQIIAIASQDVGSVDIKFQYAIQNAAADVLNRAGVKEKQDDTKEVRVVLESGIELGTPDGND